jgi:serralysin
MIWTRLTRAMGTRAQSTRSDRPSILRVELLEDRSVPAATSSFAFTANAFSGGSFNPFPGFTGQVTTASADINGDGVPDIIAAEGPGPGSQSEVRIFDGAAAKQGQAKLIADFFPYSNVPGASQAPGFDGGVYVAAAALNGTGDAQLITSTAAGGQGNVKVFDFQSSTGQFLGSNPTLLTSFFAYPGYDGNVTVAAVSQGTGLPPLLITASGAGTTSSDVRVYTNPENIGQVPSGTTVYPSEQMFAFPGFLGGVSIAAGGTTAGPQLYLEPSTGTPVVSVYDLTSAFGGLTLTRDDTFSVGTGTPTNNFLAAADVNNTGTLDLLTSSSGNVVTTPITAYSVADGTATPVTLPAGFQTFQGFGLFGNAFLDASAFTAPTFETGTTGVGTLGTGTTGVSTLGTGTSTLGTGSTGTTTAGSTALNNGVTTGVGTGTGVNTGLGGTTSTPSQTSLAQTGVSATTGSTIS